MSATAFRTAHPRARRTDLDGVLAIGGEYGTGMIRLALVAIPRRGTLLAAKALVLAAPAAAAALAAAAAMLAGCLVLPGHGFTPRCTDSAWPAALRPGRRSVRRRT